MEQNRPKPEDAASQNWYRRLEEEHARALELLLSGKGGAQERQEAKDVCMRNIKAGVQPRLSASSGDPKEALSMSVLGRQWPDSSADALREVMEMYLQRGMVRARSPVATQLNDQHGPRPLYGAPLIELALRNGHMQGLSVILDQSPVLDSVRLDPRPMVGVLFEEASIDYMQIRSDIESGEQLKADDVKRHEDQKRLILKLIEADPVRWDPYSVAAQIIINEERQAQYNSVYRVQAQPIMSPFGMQTDTAPDLKAIKAAAAFAEQIAAEKLQGKLKEEAEVRKMLAKNGALPPENPEEEASLPQRVAAVTARIVPTLMRPTPLG